MLDGVKIKWCTGKEPERESERICDVLQSQRAVRTVEKHAVSACDVIAL